MLVVTVVKLIQLVIVVIMIPFVSTMLLLTLAAVTGRGNNLDLL